MAYACAAHVDWSIEVVCTSIYNTPNNSKKIIYTYMRINYIRIACNIIVLYYLIATCHVGKLRVKLRYFSFINI